MFLRYSLQNNWRYLYEHLATGNWKDYDSSRLQLQKAYWFFFQKSRLQKSFVVTVTLLVTITSWTYISVSRA